MCASTGGRGGGACAVVPRGSRAHRGVSPDEDTGTSVIGAGTDDFDVVHGEVLAESLLHPEDEPPEFLTRWKVLHPLMEDALVRPLGVGVVVEPQLAVRHVVRSQGLECLLG